MKSILPKKKLTSEQYNICFLKGTEPPFSGKYTDNKETGKYLCVACGNELFSSDTKYDSQTGWPSFWGGLNESEGAHLRAKRRQVWSSEELSDQKVTNLIFEDDYSMGIHRTEVLCSNCGSHLGHVFEDGPPPTGKRYCINSLALEFVPKI